MRMHRSCHSIASQLSCICIAVVMRMHRSCHSIASQLSCICIAAVIQSHRSCHVFASQLSFNRIAVVIDNTKGEEIFPQRRAKASGRSRATLTRNRATLTRSCETFRRLRGANECGGGGVNCLRAGNVPFCAANKFDDVEFISVSFVGKYKAAGFIPLRGAYKCGGGAVASSPHLSS